MPLPDHTALTLSAALRWMIKTQGYLQGQDSHNVYREDTETPCQRMVREAEDLIEQIEGVLADAG